MIRLASIASRVSSACSLWARRDPNRGLARGIAIGTILLIAAVLVILLVASVVAGLSGMPP
jgi:hypothetical protein